MTFWTFLVGTLAISGIPLFAGFYSKDEILAAAYGTGHRVLFSLALFTAFLTAAYMARLLFLTFFGSFRGGGEAEHHVHESPWSMLVPLVLLAGGSIVAGYPLFRSPEGEGHGLARLPSVVQPVFRMPEEPLATPGWLPLVATLSAVIGILVAWYLYLSMPDVRASVKRRLSPLLRVFAAKYWFDDVYDGFVRRVVVDGSRTFLWQRFDAGFIDGIVNGSGRAAAWLGQATRPVETGFVRHYALLVLAGAVALVSYLLWS